MNNRSIQQRNETKRNESFWQVQSDRWKWTVKSNDIPIWCFVLFSVWSLWLVLTLIELLSQRGRERESAKVSSSASTLMHSLTSLRTRGENNELTRSKGNRSAPPMKKKKKKRRTFLLFFFSHETRSKKKKWIVLFVVALSLSFFFSVWSLCFVPRSNQYK